MKRIGLFGGSFNPIHLGHTALAAYICEQGLVDEVWLLVSPQNPLKQDLTLLDENERLHMARLAVAPYPMLKACDFEFTLPRPSYTYHTLQALRKAYPDCEFSLIIGEDNWNNFHRWYRGEDIARETPIIIYPREVEGKESSTNSLRPMANGQQSPKLLPYSSTEVRDLIASGHDASHMLHPDVAQYIKERQFYSNLAE
jgi:nicotinate-nucleotide adenylyltransferase